MSPKSDEFVTINLLIFKFPGLSSFKSAWTQKARRISSAQKRLSEWEPSYIFRLNEARFIKGSNIQWIAIDWHILFKFSKFSNFQIIWRLWQNPVTNRDPQSLQIDQLDGIDNLFCYLFNKQKNKWSSHCDLLKSCFLDQKTNWFFLHNEKFSKFSS